MNLQTPQTAQTAPHRPGAQPVAQRPTKKPDGRESAGRAPAGYILVDDDRHQIGLRDLVFVGGRSSTWLPARRAGELGNVRRDSVALAVAVLVN